MKKRLITIISCFISIIASAQFNDSWYSGRDRDSSQMMQDTIKKDDVPHYRAAWKWMHDGAYKRYIEPDTLMDGIHNYNLIFKESVSNTYLANFPSPYESDIFINRSNNQLSYRLNRVNAYLFKPSDALEYNTTTPYTLLEYFNGGPKTKSENWLDIIHYQNITPVWSAGIRYNLISSIGSYANQKSKTYNFSFFSSYEKERIALSFFVNQNVGHFYENGGIDDLSEIRDTTFDSASVLTRLSSDPSVSNNYQNFNLHTLIQYNIGGKKSKKSARREELQQKPHENGLDSAGLEIESPIDTMEILNSMDSLRNPEIIKRLRESFAKNKTLSTEDSTVIAKTILRNKDVGEAQNGIAIDEDDHDNGEKDDDGGSDRYPLKATLAFRMEKNIHRFKEPQIFTNFFNNSFITESGSNADISKENYFELNAKLILNEHPRYTYLPGIYAGIDYTQISHMMRIGDAQDSTISDYGKKQLNGTWLTAGIFNMDSIALFQFDVTGKFCLVGDYLSNYSLSGEITQYLNKNRNSYLTAEAKLEKSTPNEFLNFYFGNHNKWENNFNSISGYHIKGDYINIKHNTDIGLAVTNTKGYIYFDSLRVEEPETIMVGPRQLNSNLLVFTAWVNKKFKLANFYFDQKIYYQLSSNKDILSLPMIALYSHNYYQGKIFRKKLNIQFGVDLFYNTAFYANAYDPGSMQFSKQRFEKTGNYPKMDLFLVFNIERADIFVKFEHFTQRLGNRNYFSAQNYAINPMRVKYGVRWYFTN